MSEARHDGMLLKEQWLRASLALIAAFLLLLAIYHETLYAIVGIWLRSETFAHCFLIFPISGYLVWRRRNILARIEPRESYLAMAVMAVLGLGWLLGELANAEIIKQLCFVAMIPALTWSILGTSIASEIAFPLIYLLFSVPFGEFLIPILIDFTAGFAYHMVKLTGIPIYRDGTFFSLPTGDWSVVEACSGLRYLIASITLGTLYAYINYQSLTRRTVFIIAATIMPIFANGLRAFMIVMIGHFSGMTLAVGVDHLIYGWIFFGLVMALLFWTGSFWAEGHAGSFWAEGQEFDGPLANIQNNPSHLRRGRFTLASICVIAIAAIWPMRASHIEGLQAERAVVADLAVPEPASPWIFSEQPMTRWEPAYHGSAAETQASYQFGPSKVGVFLKYYQGQTQGKELVNSQNLLLPNKDTTWKMPSEGLSSIKLKGKEMKVMQGTLRSAQQQLLTWRWYWVGGRHTANDYLAKLLEAKGKFLGQAGEGAAIILVADFNGDVSVGRAVLQEFVDAMVPSIEKTLEKASTESRR